MNIRKGIGYVALATALSFLNTGCSSENQYMVIAENSKLANGYDVIFNPKGKSNEDGELIIGSWGGQDDMFGEAIYIDIKDGRIDNIDLSKVKKDSNLEKLIDKNKIKEIFEYITD